jgi:hypothetical protein
LGSIIKLALTLGLLRFIGAARPAQLPQNRYKSSAIYWNALGAKILIRIRTVPIPNKRKIVWTLVLFLLLWMPLAMT